jgi:hypothetical protein
MISRTLEMFTWLPRHIQVVLPGNLDVDLESLLVVLQRLLVLALYPVQFTKVVEGRRHILDARGRPDGLDLEGFLAVLNPFSYNPWGLLAINCQIGI